MSNRGIGGIWSGLIAFGLWAGAVVPAWGDVAFSTLGPEDDWDHHHAYVVIGPDGVGSPRPYAPAMPFTPDFSAILTSIELPLGVGLIPGTNSLAVALLDDNDGLPGDVIDWFVFEDLPFMFDPNQPLSVAISEQQPVLDASSTYWLAVFPGSDDTSGGWNFSNPLQTGVIAFSRDSGETWNLQTSQGTAIAAFRINGDPVEGQGQ
jgi:hypothetical protein